MATSKEVRQFYTEYTIGDQETFVDLGRYFSEIENGEVGFQFQLPSEKSLTEKIIFYFYKWLETISNFRTFVFLQKKSIYLRSYLEVIKKLHTLGLIESFDFKGTRFNDCPHIYHYSITGKLQPSMTDGRVDVPLYGVGVSDNEKEAASRAIGEFLERFSLLLYKKEKLIRSSFHNLRLKGYRAINPTSLSVFSDVQKSLFPRRNVDEQSMFFWEKLERYSTQERIFIPASLVYWNYFEDEDIGEPLLREHNTNGCAGFFTKEGAMLSGLYELIQRDAFMLYWYNRATPAKINAFSIPDESVRELIKRIEKYNFTVHCMHITVDTNVPTFISILEDNSGVGPKFSIGLGTSLDPIKGIKRAIEESIHLYSWNRRHEIVDSFEMRKEFSDNSIDQEKRSGIFSNPRYKENYAFLIGGETRDFNTFNFKTHVKKRYGSEELMEVISMVESLGAGYEVYFYNPRIGVLSSLGYFSSRVIVPKLVPLHLHEPNAAVGMSRIWEIQQKMEWQQTRDINAWPHPFP